MISCCGNAVTAYLCGSRWWQAAICGRIILVSCHCRAAVTGWCGFAVVTDRDVLAAVVVLFQQYLG
jgi:hypothetical protein